MCWKSFRAFLHVSQHVQMDLSFVVVPDHVYANVSVSRPIGFDLVMFLEDGHEVVNVVFSGVFDAKAVNNECERNESCDVLP